MTMGILIIGEYWKRLKSLVLPYLAILLAKYTECVYFTVIEATEREKEDASICGVNLILPKIPDHSSGELPSKDWLILHKEYYPRLNELDIQMVIGHYPTTAKATEDIKNLFPEPKKKALLFDVRPEDCETTEGVANEHQVLDEILMYGKNSDAFILLGPKVQSSLQDIHRRLNLDFFELKWCCPISSFSSQSPHNKEMGGDTQPEYIIASFVDYKTDLDAIKMTARSIGKSSDIFHTITNKRKSANWIIYCCDENYVKPIKDYLLDNARSPYLHIEVHCVSSFEEIIKHINSRRVNLFLETSQAIFSGKFLLWMLLVAAGIPTYVSSQSNAAATMKNMNTNNFIIDLPPDFKAQHLTHYDQIIEEFSLKILSLVVAQDDVVSQANTLQKELKNFCDDIDLQNSMELFFDKHFNSKGVQNNTALKDGQPIEKPSKELEEMDVTTSDSEIHSACRGGHIDVVKSLLREGVDVNVQGNYRRTPLHYAALFGCREIVELLLDNDADPESKTENKESPLQLASQGNESVVKLLLERHANVNSQDKFGYTPLFESLKYGREDIAKLLIENCADVNIREYNGRTPLHVALYYRPKSAKKVEIGNKENLDHRSLPEETGYGCTEMVKLLLDNKAEINIQSNFGCTPLHRASWSGQEDMVKLLINKGADVNRQQNLGWTPLHHASLFGNESIVRFLIEKGSIVNIINKEGKIPLHYAAQEGHETVVELLLENGADADSKADDQCASIHRASWNGHETVVRLLLDKGADINIRQGNLWTPLHHAARYNHLEVAKLLIDKGANINIAEKDGWTPLKMASEEGNHEIVQLLESNDAARPTQFHRQSSVNVKSQLENFISNISFIIEDEESRNVLENILHSACRSGAIGVVDTLLKIKIDIDIRGKYGRTPLHYASWYGNCNIIALLLENGADIEARTINRATPLQLASQRYQGAVQILLDKGADVNSKDNCDYTPLHESLRYGENMVTKLLVERGADVNSKDKDGLTPLHLASQYGFVDAAKFLLDSKADIDNKGNKDQTPLFEASKYGHESIARLLLDRGSCINCKNKNGSTPLDRASWGGHHSVVQLLIARDADVNNKQKRGLTPLHYASKYGFGDIAELLLKHNADANAPNLDEETPLHFASKEGFVAIAKTLVENGADLNCEDRNKRTPLHMASRKGHEDVVTLLLEKGADLKRKDMKKWTPLHYSVNGGHEAVTDRLIESGADVNTDEDGVETPLQLALQDNSLAKKLLKNGAKYPSICTKETEAETTTDAPNSVRIYDKHYI